MLRHLVNFLAFTALIYVSLCAMMFLFQRSFIYYPQPGSLGAASVLKLSVADAELVVSTRPLDGPKAIIYFGGNAEDVSFNLPAFSHAFPDHALYLLNYRGYGGSSGTPSEQALQQDAIALFDRVHADHPEIVLMGRSLGSGVAVWLAAQRPVHRLVLITPYASLAELGAQQFPYLPVKWLLRDKFESWRYAGKITVPTLLVAAENDTLIPRSSTEALYASFPKQVASLKMIPGVGHNTISDSPLYLETLRTGL